MTLSEWFVLYDHKVAQQEKLDEHRPGKSSDLNEEVKQQLIDMLPD